VTAVAAVGLAAVAAGCLGAAAPSGSTAPAGGPPAAPAPAAPATRVVVRYVLTRGRGAGLPVLHARCPALARCRARAIPGSRPRRRELVVSRTLTCAPASGGYRDPAAACRALHDLARLEARSQPNVCMCVFEPAPQPSATGRIDRRHVVFTLGACAACGLGGHASADMRVLIPSA
jgi:hypothetical protein